MKVRNSNNILSSKNIDLAKEWNYDKNEDILPSMVSVGMRREFWWKCERGHEWKASISARHNRKQRCPYCTNQKVCKENSLETMSPQVSEEWDYSKNGELKPINVMHSSNKKVWWICKKGHEWETTVRKRTCGGSGCPYCAKVRVAEKDSIIYTHPNICKHWDYNKNKSVSPNTVSHNSNGKVWWVCEKGHEWSQYIRQQIKNQCCPYCSGKKATFENFFGSKRKDLMEDWDFNKNSVSPYTLKENSDKRVWWKCTRGHGWEQTVKRRAIDNYGCPTCKKVLRTSLPEQILFFYIKKIFSDALNGHKLTKAKGNPEVDIFIPSINTVIEYDGYYFHQINRLSKDIKKSNNILEDKYTLIRIREIGCPVLDIQGVHTIYYKPINNYSNISDVIKNIFNYLNGRFSLNINLDVNLQQDIFFILQNTNSLQKENNLLIKYPLIAKEWNYERNGELLPENFSPHTSKKVWWLCSKNHEWITPICNRTSDGTGCPICANRIVIEENSILETHPVHSKEWCHENNISIEPSEVSYGSTKVVWWKCDKGHQWKEKINKKLSRNFGCHQCNKENKLLLNTYPDLVEEWNLKKNSIELSEVTYGSKKKVWWQCKKGHEWETTVSNRTFGKQGCPYCSNRKATKENSIATKHPISLKYWDYDKNKFSPHNLTHGSEQKVWWKCPNCKNSYEMMVFQFKQLKNKCQKCKH